MDFIPLEDIPDDSPEAMQSHPDAIVARLLSVVGAGALDDDQGDEDQAETGVSWAVKASRWLV